METPRTQSPLFGALTLLVVLCSVASAEARPIPVGTKTYYRGNIVSGENFGIRIRSREGDINASTRQKFLLIRRVNCDANMKNIFNCSADAGSTFYLYSVNQFAREGNLIIEYKDGQVYRLVWDFQLLPPVDF